jgi:hypothetical protein
MEFCLESPLLENPLPMPPTTRYRAGLLTAQIDVSASDNPTTDVQDSATVTEGGIVIAQSTSEAQTQPADTGAQDTQSVDSAPPSPDFSDEDDQPSGPFLNESTTVERSETVEPDAVALAFGGS